MTLTGVNEAPTVNSSSKLFTEELLSNGTLVELGRVNDGDCCDTFSVNVSSSDLPCVQAEIDETGEVAVLSFMCSVHLDAFQTYYVILSVTDNGVPPLSSSFSVNISAIVELKLQSPSSAFLDTDSVAGSVAFTVTSSIARVSFSIVDAGLLPMLRIDPVSGEVTLTRQMAWNTDPHLFMVTVSATNEQQQSASTSVLLYIRCDKTAICKSVWDCRSAS